MRDAFYKAVEVRDVALMRRLELCRALDLLVGTPRFVAAWNEHERAVLEYLDCQERVELAHQDWERAQLDRALLRRERRT
jgi:hypothetical protein